MDENKLDCLTVIFFLKALDNLENPTSLYSIANSPYICARRQIQNQAGCLIKLNRNVFGFPTHLGKTSLDLQLLGLHTTCGILSTGMGCQKQPAF